MRYSEKNEISGRHGSMFGILVYLSERARVLNTLQSLALKCIEHQDIIADD